MSSPNKRQIQKVYWATQKAVNKLSKLWDLSRYDRDDLFQEAVIGAWEGHESYRGGDYFHKLYTKSWHRLLDFITQKPIEKKSAFPKERIEEALQDITAKKDQKKIFVWLEVLERINDRQPTGEIAEAMNMKKDTVVKIRTRLAKKLKSHIPEIEEIIPPVRSHSTVRTDNGESSLKKVSENFDEMQNSEIMETYQVSRSTAWRARKQGFLMVGKSKHYVPTKIKEEEIVAETKENQLFWSTVKNALDEKEWLSCWEWAFGLTTQINDATLEKARQAILNH